MKKKTLMLLGLTVALTAAVGCGKKESKYPSINDGITIEEDTDNLNEDYKSKVDIEENEEEIEPSARIYGRINGIEEGQINVDNESDISASGEMLLTINPESTIIIDSQTQTPIELTDVQPGKFVAYLGDAMTMSLPPECETNVVFANIQEDEDTPYYISVKEKLTIVDGNAMLTAADGTSCEITPDTTIRPYKTKNIVTEEDIVTGGECLVWTNSEGVASTIIVLE